jgi:DNA-binding ferritin-like protein
MPKVKTIRLSKGTPNKDLRMSNENEKLREEIKELHNMVDDLSGWVAGVEADNDTLRKEIARLKEEREEARRDHLGLLKEVKDLTDRHAHMRNIALGARADVHQTRRDLDKANKERDAARRDFCNASYDDPHLVAQERGWDCFKNEKQHTYICDHCGDPVDSDNVFFFHTLPQDIASANKGESATTCRKCCEMIEANANNQEFRTTDMG